MPQPIAQETGSDLAHEKVSVADVCSPPAAAAPQSGSHQKSSFVGLAVGSIGVVYGDIGTSPLYALRESLVHSKPGGITESGVIGTVSLLLWALFFTVTAKYVLFLMRADNKGEGGTLSLMALTQSALGRRAVPVFFLGVAGAALFSGDAIITPAISVLSALEGLELVTPVFDPYILPLTIVILVSVFWVQSSGTAKVAAFFGPVMIVFFATIGLLGLLHIGDAPRILLAFNPLYGLRFLFGHGLLGFVVLGSVFLAVTGAEALYADMGHFGRRPIQTAWLVFVLPALTLNYLGQGALVLSDPAAVDNPFFLLAPAWGRLPLVILSTAATVIASQAVITGAFSLARQAIQLGLLPRMLILHTSETQEGQIFIPRVNRLLLLGVLVLVFLFKNSSALASAYGIAVTGTMVVTTALAFVVVWKRWHWPFWAAALFVSAFLVIDIAFLAANLLKIVEGGWVPLVLACCSMVLMWTWVRGQRAVVAQDATRLDPARRSPAHARKIQADAGRGHGDLPDEPSGGRAVLAHAQPQAQQGAARARAHHVRADGGHAARAGGQTLRDRGFVGELYARYPALRLYGEPAHPLGAGDAAKVGAEVRHHDDIVLSRPPHHQDVAQFGHALLAGQALRRPVETGGERDGLLRHSVRTRGRTRGAGDGVANASP